MWIVDLRHVRNSRWPGRPIYLAAQARAVVIVIFFVQLGDLLPVVLDLVNEFWMNPITVFMGAYVLLDRWIGWDPVVHVHIFQHVKLEGGVSRSSAACCYHRTCRPTISMVLAKTENVKADLNGRLVLADTEVKCDEDIARWCACCGSVFMSRIGTCELISGLVSEPVDFSLGWTPLISFSCLWRGWEEIKRIVIAKWIPLVSRIKIFLSTIF